MKLTKHGEKRCQHRGLRQKDLKLIFENADMEADMGGGAILYRVSGDASNSEAIGDKGRRYGILFSADGTLVTVMPIRRSGSGRRYRRTTVRRTSDHRRTDRRWRTGQ